MSLDHFDTLSKIIGFIATVVSVVIGSKYLINKSKKVEGDDNSIVIGDKNKIKNSFNREK